MTERNGTRPPTGERGITIADTLTLGTNNLPYSVTRYGLEDYTRPTAHDLEEMLARDGMAQALYYLLTFLIGDAQIQIEGEGPKADHVRKNLLGEKSEGGMSTPMGTVLKQAASAVAVKRAPFELVWEHRDGKTWLKKIKHLPVATCYMVPTKTGSFDGFVQRTTQNILSGEAPPKFGIGKAFVYIHDGALKPLEGRSALGPAWHEYTNKTKARHLTHLHLQQFALGIKHVITQSEAEEDHKSLQNRGEQVNGGGTFVTGPSEDLKIHTAGSTSEFSPYLSYIDRQMGVSTLMQWLNLGGSEGSGSQSLSRDHSSFTVSQADGTLRQIAEDFTRYVIDLMVGYNFGPNSGGDDPTLKLGPISEAAKRECLELYKLLATAPASRVNDKNFRKIEAGALSNADIEPEYDEDADTEARSGAPQQSPQPEESAEDDELERARRIVRGES